MQRRSVLLGAALTASGFAGCISAVRDAPEATAAPPAPGNSSTDVPTASPTITGPEPPGCDDPDRPEPGSGSEVVEPASYPNEPPSLADDEAVAAYVRAYEEAYRRNDLIEQHGNELRDVQIGVGEPRFYESPPGSRIARTTYTYGYTVGSTIADSPNTHVSYYVDNSVVVRAEHVGVLDDEGELEPDPLVDGEVLECFD